VIPWIKRLMQTRKFHPAWIVLAVLGIILAAGLVLLPALYEGAKEPPHELAPVEPHPGPADVGNPDLGQGQAVPAQPVKPPAAPPHR
jgi:predicted Zn-dependent peptidase